MVVFTKAAFLALGLSAGAYALEAVILADTDRDGRVTLADKRDGRDRWTKELGALFLPNIVDTDGLCSKLALAQSTDDIYGVCNDASDNILRRKDLLAPLLILANTDVPKDAKGYLTLSGTKTK